MKLPFQFGFKKKETKNHFLALLLQDEWVGAVVLEESAGMIRVVGHAEERFLTSLEEAPYEEWLSVIDRAVSTAEQNLPGKIQTEKTVFGVKQDWLIEGKIKRGYLTRLKKICEELALQPIGFLVFTEAILHLLQKEEGAPVSAILVELGKKFIILSVIRAGRIIETKLIPFTKPVAYAVDNALKEFSVEILPSRIILFNNEENKPLSQEFISHSWSKTLPFLHMPQITVLPSTFDTKSVLDGTAAQLGFAVIGADNLPIKTRTASADIPSFAKPTAAPMPESELPEEEEEASGQALSEEETEEEEALPFTEKKESNAMLNDNVSAEYFGFMQNADVAASGMPKKQPGKHILPPEEVDETMEELAEEIKEEETEEFSPTNLSTSAMLLFAGVKKGIQNILKTRSLRGVSKQLQHVTAPLFARFAKSRQNDAKTAGEEDSGSSLPFPTSYLAIGGGVVVLVLLILFYFFGISAKVTLTAAPKVLSNQQPVSFVTSGTTDFTSGIIVGQTVSTDEKGSLSQATTGTKEVGTPAKGQITIFSTLTSSTTISKGTVIVSDNNLKYTLDSDVSVASSSGVSSDPNFVQTANVNVTSADIGPSYNLPSGTKFSISGYSKGDISGKNDTAFSGGTKKDIVVVSQADVDALSTSLIKSLEAKAKTDLGQQVGGNKTLLPFFTKEDLSEKSFDKNVGDQAQSLSLTATVTYQGIVVDKNDMTAFATHILQGSIPSDMTLTSSGIHTDLTDIKDSKDTISGTLVMQASLLPKIDTAQLAKDLAGKSFQEAGNTLKSLPQIQSVDFALSPNLPLLPSILPRLSSHITITLVSQ